MKIQWSICIYFFYGYRGPIVCTISMGTVVHLCILYLWVQRSIYIYFIYGYRGPSIYTLSMGTVVHLYILYLLVQWSICVYFIYGTNWSIIDSLATAAIQGVQYVISPQPSLLHIQGRSVRFAREGQNKFRPPPGGIFTPN